MSAGGGRTGGTPWLGPVAHRLEAVAHELDRLADEMAFEATEPGADPAPAALLALHRACDDAATWLGADVLATVARLRAAAEADAAG